jgi:hypothetical protein
MNSMNALGKVSASLVPRVNHHVLKSRWRFLERPRIGAVLHLQNASAALFWCLGSSSAYGTRYVDRRNALEIDPIALGLKKKA